jgi:hypothetical protein
MAALTPAHEAPRRGLVSCARLALVITAGACWIGSWQNVMRQAASASRDAQLMHQPAVWWLLTLVLAGALLAWALRYAQGVAGSVAFACLWIGAHVEHALFARDEGVRHGKFLAGAALFAWLLGYALARSRGDAEREKHAHEWACGAVAALYLIAGLSKLWGAGLGWGHGGGVAMEIAAASSFGFAPLRALRTWTATAPLLPALFASGTLLIELAGGLFVVPRFRRAVAWLTASMHLGILLLLGFHYLFLWSPLVFGLAYSSLDRKSAAA